MATTIESQTAPVRGQPDSADQRPADVFVILWDYRRPGEGDDVQIAVST
jgi:hypothetical protein